MARWKFVSAQPMLSPSYCITVPHDGPLLARVQYSAALTVTRETESSSPSSARALFAVNPLMATVRSQLSDWLHDTRLRHPHTWTLQPTIRTSQSTAPPGSFDLEHRR
ncbi:hypothetical protein BJY52DRAFT_1193751 [Lactarius psammicola]|nr:hypothetical protein BJY52DRAFT_1193751 [Lactarius psammicola]